MSYRYRLLLIVSLIVLVLDQATKLHIAYHFPYGASMTVIDGFFSLVHVRNQGAAFGILADSAMRVPFFVTVAVLACLGLLWYLSRLREDQRFLQFSLALIFAGAVGNLIDRIRLGEVIDFIDIYWRSYHWPAFNVADSAITVGVVLLLIDTFIEERRNKRAQEPS